MKFQAVRDIKLVVITAKRNGVSAKKQSKLRFNQQREYYLRILLSQSDEPNEQRRLMKK